MKVHHNLIVCYGGKDWDDREDIGRLNATKEFYASVD